MTIDFSSPKTIFAPSDEAFEHLLKSYQVYSIEELHRRVGGREYFEEILEFHILPKRIRLLEFQETTTYSIHGKQMGLIYINDTLRIIRDAFSGSSSIIQYDIPVHKGGSIIHKIHRVLRPNYNTFRERDLIQEVNRLGFHHFLTGLSLVDGLRDSLLNLKGVTLFVPNNAAFQDLMRINRVTRMEDLAIKMGYDKFSKMMLSHVIPELVWFPSQNQSFFFQTMNKKEIEVVRKPFGTIVYDPEGNPYKVLVVDNSFKNGYMHVLDRVILP